MGIEVVYFFGCGWQYQDCVFVSYVYQLVVVMFVFVGCDVGVLFDIYQFRCC